MKRFYASMLALIMIFTLCACGAASSAKQESAPAEPAAAMDMAYTMNSAGGFGMVEEAVETEFRGEDGGDVPEPELDPEKIIYSADATLETTEFDAALSGVLELAVMPLAFLAFGRYGPIPQIYSIVCRQE